ncbi:Phage terminase small subunit [Marininema mesophilum]|uniref:Phage terminase small subunit n=1 Tax=Marininema mesophilum TaxID=1048340 RepID=A0A1H2RCI6_9BACL|nr:phage terminase small subunit [Marininema mesophilum]SDW17025.1 Phage terminase small subunit [Marininema mesophilum]
MARARSPNRDKAFEIWKEHDGEITNRKIAEMVAEKEKTISAWKSRDKWNVVLQSDECSTTKRKRGAPKGNQNAKGHGVPKRNRNAVGNRGGRPASGNQNARKHGLFAKYVPLEVLEIMDALNQEDPRLN